MSPVIDRIGPPAGGPLEGVRILDIGSLIAGPFTATLLAELGADVVKVEQPSGDSSRAFGPSKDGTNVYWKTIGRNKRSIVIDLRTDAGRERFLRLAAVADVVIENFRPGTLERWGVGWDRLEAINPSLVLLRTSGFGASGPYAQRPGYGTLAEALSGFAHTCGPEDGPPMFPHMPVADLLAATYGAVAVIAAIYHRDARDGSGQWLDHSIYEPILRGLELAYSDYDQLGVVRRRIGNRYLDAAPRGAYETSEPDRWVALSGSNDATARRILLAVERPDLADDPALATNAGRVAEADRVNGAIADWMSRHTRDEVLARFDAMDAPIAAVYDAADIHVDPHFRARGSLVEVPDDDLGTVTLIRSLPRFSGTPLPVPRTGPRLGEHDDVIDREWLGGAARERSAGSDDEEGDDRGN